MAKIKIKGADSGSAVYTLTTGTGSTDRTINLPDATATLSTFNPDGAVVINESGADVDFRVESDTVTNALFVDGAKGNIGVGTTPQSDWYSGYHIIQLGEGSAVGSYVDNSTYLSSNWKDDSANKYINTDEASVFKQSAGKFIFQSAPSGSANAACTLTTRLEITNDGRGLSQFTAKAWVNFNQVGTQAIRDSHNVSSISDFGAGRTQMNYSNNMANGNYATVASSNAYHVYNSWSNGGDIEPHDPLVGSVKIVSGINNGYVDSAYVSIVVFGD